MRHGAAWVALSFLWPCVALAQDAGVPVKLRMSMDAALPRGKTAAITPRPAERLILANTWQPQANLVAQSAPVVPETPAPALPSVPQPALKPTAPAAPRPAYVDQVLDESPLQITTGGLPGSAEAEPKGRRFLSVDYKLYARDASGAGRSLEHGTSVRYRRETQDYGELYFEGELRNYRPATFDTLPANSLGYRASLSQFNYALTERWQMDNTLGLTRGNASPLITNSFRIQLPTSVLQGVSSTVYDAQSEWRFSSGRLAQLSGVATQQVDVVSGNLTSVGYTRRFTDNWSAGALVNSMTGHAFLPDTQSAAGALQYWSGDRRQRLQLHAISDARGRAGVWFDADQKQGFAQHRYGVYRIEPNVTWTDALIINDQQGGYWRTDYRTQRYTLAGGADLTDNNLRNDAARAGSRLYSGFVSGFWRIDRTLSMNANANVSHNEPKFQTLGVASSTTTVANAGIAKTLEWGVTRAQLSHTQTESAVAPSRESTLRWDHDWTWSSARQLSTTLSHAWADISGIGSTRATAGLAFRHFVGPQFRWDGNVTFTRVHDTTGLTDNNLNAAVNGNWSINREWSAQLQFIWNRVDNTNPLAPINTRDKTLLFVLRYETASGTPLTATGLSAGGLGSGRIAGRVFFDENGDGVRQATERPVAGLTVLLDGRYRAVTDNEGRFEFGPVPTGAHEVTLLVERVPLPWGLLDETPRRVQVPLRGEALVDIPLNKLNQ